MLAERSYDYVIINLPLPDESGIDFAIDTSNEKNSIVLLLVSMDIYEEIYEKVSRHGVFSIAKPITRQTFDLALRWLEVVRLRSRKTARRMMKNRMLLR